MNMRGRLNTPKTKPPQEKKLVPDADGSSKKRIIFLARLFPKEQRRVNFQMHFLDFAEKLKTNQKQLCIR